MKFIKKNGKYIGIVMICVFCSYLTAIATNYAFDSGDVRFDNTSTSLESVNVQDAIDESFHHVTDYNEIKTTIGNNALTTTSNTLIGAVNELNSKMPTGNSFDEILIPSGSDINNYRTAGTFIVPNDSTAAQISNMPRRASGRLIVINRTTSSYIAQEYYPTSVDPIRYVRNYNNGTWTNWDQIALNSQLASLSSKIEDYTKSDATKVGSNWTGGIIRAHRRGYVVTLKLDGTVLSAASSRTQIASIPEGYRPVTEVGLRSDDGTRGFVISTSGDLRMEAQSAGTVWGAVTYVCNR